MRTPFTRTNVPAVLGLHLECVTELLLSNSGSLHVSLIRINISASVLLTNFGPI